METRPYGAGHVREARLEQKLDAIELWKDKMLSTILPHTSCYH